MRAYSDMRASFVMKKIKEYLPDILSEEIAKAMIALKERMT